MNRKMTRGTTLGLLAMLAAAALSPALADSANRQKNKNDWRNFGYIGAAVAGYGLLKHNTTATVLGAAGAAYSADRYEQDRHSQSQAQARRDRYFTPNGSRYDYPLFYRRSSHIPNGGAYGPSRHHD